jgi:hypothetical protein
MFTSTYCESDNDMNIFFDENLFETQENQDLKKKCFQLLENILKTVEPDTIIAKDLPRLGKNITIENYTTNEEILTSTSSQVLQNLSTFLNSDKRVEPEKLQELFFDVTSQFQSLFKFLTTYYGENSKELIILRCLTQKSLAQPMIYLKKLLGNADVMFRDGKWKIEIKRENGYITVTHLRKEQIDSSVPESNDSIHYKTLYTFNWKLVFFLKETEETLIIEKCRVQFVSLNDYDSKVATKEDPPLEVLKLLFKAAFKTVEKDIFFEKE